MHNENDEAARKVQITETSKRVFMAYAKDAGNWSGTPLVGGNVGGSKEEQGNLTQLKQAGLITTDEDHEPGQGKCTWIHFTDLGKAYARVNGYDINKGRELGENEPGTCECSDKLCNNAEQHKEQTLCGLPGSTTLYRIDMADETGTVFCDDCASDAMDSGLFTDSKNEDEPTLRLEDEPYARNIEATYPLTDDQPYPSIDPKGDLGTNILEDFEDFSQDRQYATDILIEEYLGTGQPKFAEISPRGRTRIRELLMLHAKRTGETIADAPAKANSITQGVYDELTRRFPWLLADLPYTYLTMRDGLVAWRDELRKGGAK